MSWEGDTEPEPWIISRVPTVNPPIILRTFFERYVPYEIPLNCQMILFMIQWVGFRENLQESPIFNGEIHGFL
jgi:hypothetical protein